MGFRDYEDYMMIKCSPIREIGDIDTFLANISVITDDFEVTKFCGFQIPQYHLSYNDGFTDEEVAEISEYLKEHEDKLVDMAKCAEVPEDAPEGDSEFI